MLAKNLGKLSNELTGFIQETQAELIPALRDLRQVLQDADNLTTEITDKVQRVDGVITNVGSFVDGKMLPAAYKALSRSKLTAVSVLEGIRQGLKAFRSAGGKKEESNNEPQQ